MGQTIVAPIPAAAGGGTLRLKQSYRYDVMNRIAWVDEAVLIGQTGGDWLRSFDGDARGNLWVTGSTHTLHAAVPNGASVRSIC